MTKTKSKSDSEYKDVINFEPVPIMIVKDFDAMKLLEDPSYYIIVEILRSRPMTILEIEQAYSSRALEHMQVSAKSYNTIYRYLKALEKAELVVAAGKRVAFGKTASETLFGRTARLFTYSGVEGSWAESEKGQDFTEKVITGLKVVYTKDRLNEKCFREFLLKYIDSIKEEMERLVEEGTEDVLHQITSGEWEKMSKALDYIAIFSIFLNRPKLLKELRDCYSE
ncbi:MAG: winged helix-turn-helix domain-containing protein [Candidatus Thorarchaeota archaeon]|jgi:hypothetical protein